MHLNNKAARTLNTVCDQEATIHHLDSFCPDIPTYPNQADVEFYNIKFTSKNMNLLHTLHHKEPYITYLTDKFQWKPTTYTLIDWENIGKYTSTLTTTAKVKYTKYSHKWRPTQKNYIKSTMKEMTIHHALSVEKLQKTMITPFNAHIP